MKRAAVVGALFLMSVLFYVDRAAMSSAIEPMSKELGFSLQRQGFIMSMFALGYALAQIPGGWMADRFGPRLVLTGCVIGWSVFTGLTGLAWSLVALVVVRFLFGVAEAGALPACARVFFNWLPARERGRANGISFSGMRLGAALSFPLFAWMLGTWTWRQCFLIFGAAGVVWGVFWYVGFRDHPAEPPEKALEAAAPRTYGRILATPGMILNMVQYFAGNFTFFICLSWMLPYLKKQYALTADQAAGYAMVPLLFATGSLWITGFLVDGLYRSRWRSWSRRLPAILGFGLAVGGLLALTQAKTPWGAVACFTVATFGADMTISPSWQYCVDIGGKISGTVSGTMNMVGNVGSFVSANVFPWLLSLTGSASTYFTVAAALNAAAILCWLGMRPPK